MQIREGGAVEVEEIVARDDGTRVGHARAPQGRLAGRRPARCLTSVLSEGTLNKPEPRWRSRGGRDGLHTEHLGHLLAEMQHLHRSYPGATW